MFINNSINCGTLQTATFCDNSINRNVIFCGCFCNTTKSFLSTGTITKSLSFVNTPFNTNNQTLTLSTLNDNFGMSLSSNYFSASAYDSLGRRITSVNFCNGSFNSGILNIDSCLFNTSYNKGSADKALFRDNSYNIGCVNTVYFYDCSYNGSGGSYNKLTYCSLNKGISSTPILGLYTGPFYPKIL
jgi:hypothetical protein